MDTEGRKFGRGPRELGGSVDLINHYKLEQHLAFFCKRSLPSSISKTQYLRNVVGETEIKKGEGMGLDQLSQNSTGSGRKHKRLQPFQLDVLMDAFKLREATSNNMPYALKFKDEGKKERKHKKHKHRNNDESKMGRHKHKNVEMKMDSNMHSRPLVDASRERDVGFKRNGDHIFGSGQLLKQRKVTKVSTFLP